MDIRSYSGTLGAIDIGGTKIAVGLVTESGHLQDSVFLPTLPEQPYSAALGDVTTALENLIQTNKATPRGIGIGVTGRITPTSGMIQTNQFLPNWSARYVGQDLSAHFGITTAIENDADSAALAEYRWGVGAGAERLIYVTISTGIGGGIILNRKLYRGVDDSHPEIGHHGIDPNGPLCFCGTNGCWERMASSTALTSWARENGGEADWDARTICNLAETGNSVARLAVAREAHYLGIGLANLITIFSPDYIILGGGLMQRWELFRENVEATIRRHCGLVPWQKTHLTISQLQHTGLLGAAAVWIHHYGANHDF
jgi:glucokinase